MRGEIWVWAERRNGRLMGVSLELMGKGLELSQRLGVGLAAIVLGEQVEGSASELIAYGAGKVYLIEHPQLSLYQSDIYANAIAELVEKYQPEILLIGATSIGMDLAPRIAAKVKTGLMTHCVNLDIEQVDGNPQLVAAVPGFGGRIMVKIACPQRRPQMVTVRPGIMDMLNKDGGRQGQIIKEQVDLRLEDMKARTIELVEEEPIGIPLEEAETVVAVGWGVQSVENLNMIKEMAVILDAALGGTRPAVDKGWVPEEVMIGQSGKVISPKLLISLGASGATAFSVGFLKTKVVLAVDKNPEASIFDECDIGIVADLQEILPLLVEEFKQAGKWSRIS
ncbi:electron transfer flavoprotein subunit alpha/FixB family protein [Chloroflexota bacterium]